jgi:tetratricopeptide (TPR) repeat protein
MNTGPEALEREAYSFLSEEKFEEAFNLFKRAALTYQHQRNHKQATLCFASAASCWNKKHGERTFVNAALSYEKAARQAERYGDLEYASILYKYAAVNHEKDLEFLNFSDCFYRSKECYRRFLTYRLLRPDKINPIAKTEEKKGLRGFIRRLILLFALTFSFVVWGHGERPARTLFSGIAIILISAALYSIFGGIIEGSMVSTTSLVEALYFSVVTFTTLGYGDITPVGLSRLVAMIEAFSGMFFMPLFLVGLSRKYLRF